MTVGTDPTRRADLAMIHIACKALEMPDQDYRALLCDRWGVLSSAALNEAQRAELLAEFESRGWKRPPSVVRKRKKKYLAARGKDSAQLRKIRAMLAGADRDLAYGDAMAQRLCKVERLEWCNAAQLTKVIAALEYDKQRRTS